MTSKQESIKVFHPAPSHDPTHRPKNVRTHTHTPHTPHTHTHTLIPHLLGDTNVLPQQRSEARIATRASGAPRGDSEARGAGGPRPRGAPSERGMELELVGAGGARGRHVATSGGGA